MQRKSFSVPSFVPDWGWPEFLITVRSLLTGSAVRGAGPERFAEAVKSELGTRFAVPVNRARFGIQLAFQALELGEGDEVILPSYACEALLEPILNVRARPVFADMGPDLHLTAKTVEQAITSKTRCVIVPHHYGNVAPIDEIESLLGDRDIALIDDAAQSYGARCAGRPVGTFGICGVVSCGPAKSLGGAAGALLVTNDEQLYRRVTSIPLPPENPLSVLRRALAFWIWFRFRRWLLGLKTYSDVVLSRSAETGERPAELSDLDARLAIRQLRTWERNARRRRQEAEPVLKLLGRSGQQCITDLSSSSLALRITVILAADGVAVDDAIEMLAAAGIEARRGYKPLHHSSSEATGALPTTESLSQRVLLLPVSKRLGTRERQRALERLGGGD